MHSGDGYLKMKRCHNISLPSTVSDKAQKQKVHVRLCSTIRELRSEVWFIPHRR